MTDAYEWQGRVGEGRRRPEYEAAAQSPGDKRSSCERAALQGPTKHASPAQSSSCSSLRLLAC